MYGNFENVIHRIHTSENLFIKLIQCKHPFVFDVIINGFQEVNSLAQFYLFIAVLFVFCQSHRSRN